MIQLKKLVLGCLVLVLIVVTGVGFLKPKGAVAQVGKTYITSTDIQNRLELEAPGNLEAQSNTQNRQLVLDQLINEAVLLQTAKMEGYDRTETYKSQLKLAEKQLLINQLTSDKITPKSHVSPAEVQTFFEQNKDRFGPFESRRLSHIQLKTHAEATSVLASLKKGNDFSTLAKQKSTHPSSQKGGDIGSYQKHDLSGDFESIGAAAFGIKRKGLYSGVVKSPLGYHIVKVTDIVKRPALSLTDVQQDIYNALVTEKRRQATTVLLKEMKEQISIKKLEQE